MSEEEKTVLGVKPAALVDSVSKMGPTALLAVVFCFMFYFNHLDRVELNKSIGATLNTQVESLKEEVEILKDIANTLKDGQKDFEDFIRHHHTP